MIKKGPETVRWNTYLNPASREVTGFSELLGCFERNISILGRSFRTFAHYSRYIAAITLHYQCLHSQWDTKQIKEYLFELQQRSKTPISNILYTHFDSY